MLFPSPRYGAEALVKLIESVDEKAMLKSEIPIPVVKDVLSMKDMKTLQIPSVEQLLTSKAEPYPYNKTYQQNSREPFVCLRTYARSRLTMLPLTKRRYIRHNGLSQTHPLDTRVD